MKHIPVIRVIGRRGSGKTRLIATITSELVSRGYRVSVVKHAMHRSSFDQPGKDTWKFSKAGAHVVALFGPNEIVTIRRTRKEPSLEDVVQQLKDDSDIILVEGFKTAKGPRIEILGIGERPGDLKGLVAVIADAQVNERVPHFTLRDITGIVDLLEETYLMTK